MITDVDDWRRGITSRLTLRSAALADLGDMAALHADERVWRHFPTGRHTSVERTQQYLLRCEQQWRRDGLGYWVAELREQVAGFGRGETAGIGGCARPEEATWWNLYYRLRPELQGHGLASELCQAALAAAHDVDPDRPVIAFLLEHNDASRATAERAGLRLAWRGPDVGNPDTAAIRLIYADRPVDTAQLDAVAGRT